MVTERLGHSTAAYTQDAYQHLLPGMQHDAANRFHERLSQGRSDDAVEADTDREADPPKAEDDQETDR